MTRAVFRKVLAGMLRRDRAQWRYGRTPEAASYWRGRFEVLQVMATLSSILEDK